MISANPSLWIAARKYATPLLPKNRFSFDNRILVGDISGYISTIECSFICFDIHPLFPISKDDLLFFFLHIGLPKNLEPTGHALDHSVVHLQKQPALGMRRTSEKQKKKSSLNL